MPAKQTGSSCRSSSEDTRDALRAFLPAAASIGNPVDMLASAPPEHYEQATRLVLADAGVDSLLVIFIPPLVTDSKAVAEAIVRGAAGAAQADRRDVHERAGRASRAEDDSRHTPFQKRLPPRSRASSRMASGDVVLAEPFLCSRTFVLIAARECHRRRRRLVIAYRRPRGLARVRNSSRGDVRPPAQKTKR